MATTITRLLLLLTLLTLTSAEIRRARIHSDARPLIPLDEFGFTSTGALELNASRISLSDPSADLSKLAFLLVNRDSWIQVLHQLEDLLLPCPLLSPLPLTVYSLHQLSAAHIPLSSASFTCFYTSPEPGHFILLFANCLPHLKVSMDVTSSMYNVDPTTNLRHYLSAGSTALPHVYLLFSLLYSSLFLLWAFLLYRKRSSAFHVHLLMSVLLFLKSLDLLCVSVDKSYVDSTGAAHAWDVPFYVFISVKVITLVTIFALIGVGGSVLKPYLHDSERTVLMVAIPLQVATNVAQAVIDESAPAYAGGWATWKQVLVLVDVVCCFAVLLTVIWSIKSLGAAARTDGKAAVALKKLALFGQFYMVVVGYIYFTRVAVFVTENMASYEFRWTGEVAGEVATLGFYVFTGYKFRPVVQNPYFALDEEEEDSTAAEAAKLRYEVEF